MHITADPGLCNEGAVRLANGTVEQEGRLEICVNGVWGSVCDYYWDQSDAYVACKQLGYSNAGMEYITYHIRCAQAFVSTQSSCKS